MKTLGHSENSNSFIVEMNNDEYRTLLKLESSIDGDYHPFGSSFGFVGKDLSPAFVALLDLALVKQSVFSLKSYVDNLLEYFGEVKTVEEVSKNA